MLEKRKERGMNSSNRFGELVVPCIYHMSVFNENQKGVKDTYKCVQDSFRDFDCDREICGVIPRSRRRRVYLEPRVPDSRNNTCRTTTYYAHTIIIYSII